MGTAARADVLAVATLRIRDSVDQIGAAEVGALLRALSAAAGNKYVATPVAALLTKFGATAHGARQVEHDCRLRLRLLITIANLASDSRVYGWLVAARAAPLILRLEQWSPRRSAMQLACWRALLHIGTEEERRIWRASSRLGQAAGLKRGGAILDVPAEWGEVAELAAHRSNHASLVDANVFELVVELRQMGSDSQRQFAAEVLLSLAVNPELTQHVCESNALTCILRLEEVASLIALQGQVLIALAKNEELRPLMIGPGLIVTLLQRIRFRAQMLPSFALDALTTLLLLVCALMPIGSSL